MGHKTNPIAMRLGSFIDSDSCWFSTKDYASFVKEDVVIRRFIDEEFRRAGVSRVIIQRKAGSLEVIVVVARPGYISSKSGIDIGILVETLSGLVGRKVVIVVKEEKNPDLAARLVADFIAVQLEKRVPFRRVLKQAVQRVMRAGGLGVKATVSGRLGGAEIARSEYYREGSVPLNTLSANIGFGFSEALTTVGKIGIKVLVYSGTLPPKGSDRVTAG